MHIYSLFHRRNNSCREDDCAGRPGIISLQKDPEGKQSQLSVLGFDGSQTEILLNHNDRSTILRFFTPEGRELPPLHGRMGKETEM